MHSPPPLLTCSLLPGLCALCILIAKSSSPPPLPYFWASRRVLFRSPSATPFTIALGNLIHAHSFCCATTPIFTSLFPASSQIHSTSYSQTLLRQLQMSLPLSCHHLKLSFSRTGFLIFLQPSSFVCSDNSSTFPVFQACQF